MKAEIGAAIRTFREDRGLTQSDLAAGRYTKAAISAVENGKNWPSIVMLLDIADVLDVPVSALLPSR